MNIRSGVMVNGLFVESKEERPQGGSISPLSGNIMLNEPTGNWRDAGFRLSVMPMTRGRVNYSWKKRRHPGTFPRQNSPHV